MKTFRHVMLLLFIVPSLTFAQGVKISSNSGSPDPHSILELESTTQGFLPPRLSSAERDLIQAPIPEGLTIFNTTTKCLEVRVFSLWKSLCSDTCTTVPLAPIATQATNTAVGTFTANWSGVSNATHYILDVSLQGDFSSYISEHLNVGLANTYIINGLSTVAATYYYRIKAVNTCGQTFSNTISVTTISLGIGQLYLGGMICKMPDGGPGTGRVISLIRANSGIWSCNTSVATGATSNTDGASNTLLMPTGDSECGGVLAHEWVDDNFNTGGLNAGPNVWYIPSKNEWLEIHNNANVIYSALVNLGADPIPNTWYWTSTEFNASRSWRIYLDPNSGQNGETATYDIYGNIAPNKAQGNALRAIRAF